MEKHFKAYLAFMESELSELEGSIPDGKDGQALAQWQNRLELFSKHHDNKVADFQHERLVHLFVTIFFACLFLISFFLLLMQFQFEIAFYVLTAILLVLEIFYIKHYYFLENKVQSLYPVKDRVYLLKKKIDERWQ